MTTLEFKLPDIGEGVHEGEIVRWIVAEGSQVAEDDPVVEVMTDKATVEIPSPQAGTVSKQLVAEGDVAKVGDVIFVISGDGVKSSTGAASSTPTATADSAAATAVTAPSTNATPPSNTGAGGQVAKTFGHASSLDAY